MSDEVKPCPFCGAIPTIDDVIGEYNEGVLYVRLRCPNGDDVCMAEGPWVEFGIDDDYYPVDSSTLYASAVSAWNRRVEPNELPKWVREAIHTQIVNIQRDFNEYAKVDYSDNEISRHEEAIKHLKWVLSLRRDK